VVDPALPKLLNRLSGDSLLLKMLDRYYTGTQPLSFLSPDVARNVQNRIRCLVVNWPRLVVNSIEERLDVDGFRLASDQPADDDLWAIWQANDLDEQSQQCHADALVHGRAYVIVWADDSDPTTPKITVESAEQMTVDFIPGTTKVASAVKCWAGDDMAFANLFLPGEIWQYEAPLAAAQTDMSAAIVQRDWQPVNRIGHDLGIVPVVPFINRPRPTHMYGESELTDVIPLVDAINKLATDMMVSAEYHAMPRRWATGIDLGGDEAGPERGRELLRKFWTDAEAGRVWTSDSSSTQFGQFAEASLENFVRGIEMLAAQLAAIAGLPPHYVGLMSQANPASADAIRSAEASLVRRAERKMRVFGGGWERVMRLALLVRDGVLPDQAHAMETIWRDPKTRSIGQQVDAAQKLDAIGLPFRANLEDMGFTPTAVNRIIKMRADDSLANVQQQLKAADQIVEKYGFSRAAALAAVGLEAAARVEAIVEARSPGPGVINDAELAAEVAAATPAVPVPGVPVNVPRHAADRPPKPPTAPPPPPP
jgi:hypothetical protein